MNCEVNLYCTIYPYPMNVNLAKDANKASYFDNKYDDAAKEVVEISEKYKLTIDQALQLQRNMIIEFSLFYIKEQLEYAAVELKTIAAKRK